MLYYIQVPYSRFRVRRGRHPPVVSHFTKDYMKSITALPPDWLGYYTTQMVLGGLVLR